MTSEKNIFGTPPRDISNDLLKAREDGKNKKTSVKSEEHNLVEKLELMAKEGWRYQIPAKKGNFASKQ
jgi:hypothetical protein